MLRHLARLTLAATLFASATPAAATGFAAPPPTAGAPAEAAEIQIPPNPDTVRMTDGMRVRLRGVLAKRRARNVKAFRGYVQRGRFPHNFENDGALNVWRDREGNLCAAATMIHRSGARRLVAQVARTDNFIRLADVSDGPLLDWILTSGLTHDEVVAIQEPFMGRERPVEPVDWRTAEDARLRVRYAEVLAELADDRDDSLDDAVDALASRPDLIAALIGAR